MENETFKEIIATKGSSYFGSGGYYADWSVISGEVEALEIENSYDDNGFRRKEDYLLRPITPIAVVEIRNGDCIGHNGRRFGNNGIFTLVKEQVPV